MTKKQVTVFKIKKGRWYRDGSGHITGPVEHNGGNTDFPFRIGTRTYTEGGRYRLDCASDFDLIEEVPAPIPSFTDGEPDTVMTKTVITDVHGNKWTGHVPVRSDVIEQMRNLEMSKAPDQENDTAKGSEPFVVQLGRWYERRDGKAVGPALHNPRSSTRDVYPFWVGLFTCTADGKVFNDGRKHNWDLVKEIPEPAGAFTDDQPDWVITGTLLTEEQKERWARHVSADTTKPDHKALSDLASEAVAIVTGSRRDQYGGPERTFDVIASFWTAYLRAKGHDITITAADVSPMMRLMKESRLITNPTHRDSIVDIIGYALTGFEVATGGGSK